MKRKEKFVEFLNIKKKAKKKKSGEKVRQNSLHLYKKNSSAKLDSEL